MIYLKAEIKRLEFANKIKEINTTSQEKLAEFKNILTLLELKGQLLPVDCVSNLRELLIDFADEMQNIGINEVDDTAHVVDIYMKRNL